MTDRSRISTNRAAAALSSWGSKRAPVVCETQKGVHRFRHAPQLEHVIIETPPEPRQASRFASGCASRSRRASSSGRTLPVHSRTSGAFAAQAVAHRHGHDLLSALFIPRVTSVRVPFLGDRREAVRMLVRKWNDNHAPMPTVTVNRN